MTQQASLINQRKAALALLKEHPDVVRIRFTNEGRCVGPDGSRWSANAIVTIGEREYQQSVGYELGTTYGDSLPMPSESSPPMRASVIYSDGSQEVLDR